jgi:hypothetical protein
MSINLKAITSRLGYQQITDLSSAVGLAVPNRDVNGLSCKPTIAVIIPYGSVVRWRDDDVNPTDTIGMPLADGTALQYDGDLTKIKFIETSPATTLNICYYA